MSDTEEIINQDVQLMKTWIKSPIQFIKDIWKLTPQPLKEEYKDKIHTADLDKVTKDWFIPKTRREIIDGKMITWQQYLVVLSVERAVNGIGKRRISVESGHGTGKSTILAMLILWFLFCYLNAQIPCTAPSADQLFDVLWKEISLWMRRMPPQIQKKFEWQSSYVRIVESPETWFARAKTARKEAPEALAGMHGDNVMFILDEASGVPEEIFATAEGALTNENIIVIMISNHTRLVGYFHESHNSDKESWQTLSFDSRESPIVDESYVQRIITKYGKDSDEFRIRVMGKAPREEMMDEKGWLPLLSMNDIRETTDDKFTGACRLGVDAAGEGKDKAVWIVRDRFKAMVVHSEQKSTTLSMASKTIAIMDKFNIPDSETYADNFGEGANIARDIAMAVRKSIRAVNVGDEADDKLVYLNRRAEAFWRLRDWLRSGGEIYVNPALKEELLSIRYRREQGGKIQIMSKVQMKKEGLRSPDHADALMLTFYDFWDEAPMTVQQQEHIIGTAIMDFQQHASDPYDQF